MINDINGILFGKNMFGESINLDLWSRENNNIVVVGATGTGKTVLVKHTLLHQHYTGVKVILIDLNREYKGLCKALGGYWLDGNSDYTECPEQVLSASFVVIDMYDLRAESTETKISHYSKVLDWCWSRLTHLVDERVLMVIDGFTDFNIGSLGLKVHEMLQRSRSYNGGLLLTVSAAEERLCDIVTHMTYVVFMCLGSERFDSWTRRFALSDDDRYFLAKHTRNTALLTVGNTTEQFTLAIADDEMSMLGKSEFCGGF